VAVDVQLAAGHFPAGTKVSIIPRVGDFAAGTAVKTVQAKDDGVSVKGLDEGRYWAVGEIDVYVPRTGGVDKRSETRSVSFTAKDTPAPRKRTPAPTSADPQLTPSWTLGQPEIVTGARGTKVAGRTVEEPVQRGIEPHPHLNQASIGDSVPQRSSTVLGQATPTDPSEPQPKPRQEDVKKGVKQRSDTETGEATPITGEAGPDKQEDYSGPQRSDTETGEATPIGSAEPRGTASNPDSREQAAGERPTDEKKTATKKGVKPAAASKLKKS
jgi:hypothetical protein